MTQTIWRAAGAFAAPRLCNPAYEMAAGSAHVFKPVIPAQAGIRPSIHQRSEVGARDAASRYAVKWNSAKGISLFLALFSGFLFAVPLSSVAQETSKPQSQAAPSATEAIEAAAVAAEPPGPGEVTTGVYINDIQELDFRTNSYAVDLYVWFRWNKSDASPNKSLEFMNRFTPNDHVRDNLYEEPKAMPDGSRYTIIRNQGRFSAKFQLENYPFDEQVLRIVFEDTVASAADQIYVPDRIAVAINPAVTLPGFKIGTPRLEIVSNAYPTNFGDITSSGLETYSRGIVSVPVTRPLTALSVKTFVPVFLIILCASLVFFVRPFFVDGRIGLGITALLTLVALQLSGGSSLPEVDYLMMIDKVYLASYAFIILSLVRVVSTSWVGKTEDNERAIARGDKIFAALLMLGYIGTLSGIAYFGLAGLMGGAS